jgi:hypothetical protein
MGLVNCLHVVQWNLHLKGDRRTCQQPFLARQPAVSMLNRAFNDISPTFAVYANQVNIAGTTPESIRSFAIRFGEGYAMMSDSVLAGMVLNNMGLLPNTELLVDLVAYFAANPNARGFVVLQIGQILAEQEFATGAMAQYATAAVAWNKEVTSAHAFSTDPANEQFSTADPPPTFTKGPAESALADAIKANDKATTSANTLVGATALQAQAKTLADATDAVALAAAGQTSAAMAAAADDAALASATKAFSGALNDARVQVAYFKIAADTAVVLADRFVIAAANTLTSTLDDRGRSGAHGQGYIAVGTGQRSQGKGRSHRGASAAPAQAAYEAHAPALAPESPIVLVGSADAPVNHLLYIQ